MNKNAIIGLVVAAVIIVCGGITYATIKKNNDDKKAAEQTAMMKKEASEAKMKQDEAMKKEEAMKGKDSAMEQDEVMSKSGYITLADYNASKDSYANSKKVLFFHASWCPTCQSIENTIKADPNSIPAKTVIIKTDYDTQNDLKKKYGITQQYSFVQIDNDGKQIKKWSSTSLDDVLSQIQ